MITRRQEMPSFLIKREEPDSESSLFTIDEHEEKVLLGL